MKRDDFKEIKKKFLKEQKINSYDLFIEGKPNIEAIEVALRKAYNDAQPRLISNHNKIVDNLWKENEKYPMAYLKTRISLFLENKYGEVKTNYATWYGETYTEFIKRYTDIMKEKIDSSIIKKQGIGKAQKIINMSLKYLYCMADKGQEELFKECHMPLDHYTLENWFCRNIHEYEGEPFDKKQLKAWSNISDYGLYIKVQQAIRAYIEKSEYKIDSNPMTPLQVEFIIWEEEKIREALLGVINLEVNEKNQCYADLQEIKNKASEVVKKLNDEE